MNSVAFTAGDPVALAKVFAKWAGENAEFQFKLGIVDGKLLGVDEVKALATMPGKEELFSKLLFLINAPAQRLATVHQCHGPRSGGGAGPGRGEGKVCRGKLQRCRFQLSAVRCDSSGCELEVEADS